MNVSSIDPFINEKSFVRKTVNNDFLNQDDKMSCNRRQSADVNLTSEKSNFLCSRFKSVLFDWAVFFDQDSKKSLKLKDYSPRTSLIINRNRYNNLEGEFLLIKVI